MLPIVVLEEMAREPHCIHGYVQQVQMSLSCFWQTPMRRPTACMFHFSTWVTLTTLMPEMYRLESLIMSDSIRQSNMTPWEPPWPSSTTSRLSMVDQKPRETHCISRHVCQVEVVSLSWKPLGP